MEDRYVQRLAPSELYNGDANPDIDQRYKMDEVIESSSSSLDHHHPHDVFKMLRIEIESEKYQIRTPEQQADWARKKTHNTRQMAKYLLKFKLTQENLYAACSLEKPIEKLFGEFAENEDESIRLVYSKPLRDKVKTLLESIWISEGGPGTEDKIKTIVDDYNLSYYQFTQTETDKFLKRFESVKKEYESYISDLPKGASLSLLTDDLIPPSVFNLQDDLGLDWATICTIARNIKLLHSSSEALKERLVSTNLRSCFRAAMHHYHAIGGFKNVNFDEKDLISEATIGLMHAADMYVFGTSARFTTYAENWVRLKVTRYTKDNNTVRVPVHVTDMCHSIIKTLKEHERESRNSLKEVPMLSMAAVAERLGKTINSSVWEQAINRYKGMPLSVSCVTTEGDDENCSFDWLVETSESPSEFGLSENHSEDKIKDEVEHVMDIAKKLIDDNAGVRPRTAISQEQYNFLQMFFIHGMKNAEISDVSNGDIDPKYVRAEINRALGKIRRALGVKLK